MKFQIEAFTGLDKAKIISNYGLDGGRTQKVIDESFKHYMKEKMPQQSGMMINNTINPGCGLIVVNTPYAHYMNEGILYVDPQTGKGAMHDPISGRFWSRPGVKKAKSTTPLNYSGGPDRGSHFVERTIVNNKQDIIKSAQKEIDK